MVFCSIECIQKVCDYLGVTCKKLHISPNNMVASDDIIKNQTVEGFSTIVHALLKKSQYHEMLGNDRMTKALTQQWLEYAVLNVNYADNPMNIKRILKELNIALKNNSYITGTSKTIADVVLYYALHTIMVISLCKIEKANYESIKNELTYQEKAEYVNISRWFDYIQREERLRKKLNIINFDLIHLYI